MASASAMVAAVWEQALRECPDPLRNPFFLFRDPRTYRERLDYQPVNAYGEVIPRIVTVKRNIWALKKPRRAPRLPA